MRLRAGMLDGVGQRLEADAQQVVLVRRVEAARRSLDAHVGAAPTCSCVICAPGR